MAVQQRKVRRPNASVFVARLASLEVFRRTMAACATLHAFLPPCFKLYPDMSTSCEQQRVVHRTPSGCSSF